MITKVFYLGGDHKKHNDFIGENMTLFYKYVKYSLIDLIWSCVNKRNKQIKKINNYWILIPNSMLGDINLVPQTMSAL